jgi:hypothetical protein
MNEFSLGDSILEEKGIPRYEFTYPERYPDQSHVARRHSAIREMVKRGIPVRLITTWGPYSERNIYKILSNGHEAFKADNQPTTEGP